ncbi:peptidoglycan/LPS O-acetylase OafA/YrhL [Rhizobium azibense]|uniref:Peptidoglycan/LPS O-acetylase OafA/YrhL n=2 Tax=Rhizobium TaxID=379 RepID=A0A4R3R4S4_9HYPH|nr:MULTISPECIES: acyltransferase [Rhizobium]TCU28907.1 peptidoglycan/LPS O-acetylase OafA/YrhL [Rhizobium azibense]
MMQHGNLKDLGRVAAIPARNTTVDFLRAVSVLWIVGFWHPIGYSPIREVGKNAVTLMATVAALGLFVLLSGYLQGGRGRSFFDFYRRRFWRIYVPFVGASLLFIIMNIGDHLSLIKGVFLVAMLDEPAAVTLWFINMIMLFYLCTPALLWIKRRSLTLLLIISATILLGLLAADWFWERLDNRLVIYFPCFVAGIVLSGSAPPKMVWPVVFVAAVACVATLPAPTDGTDIILLPWAVLASLCVFCLTSGRLDDLSDTATMWIERAAYASFFAYLLHRPVYRMLEALSAAIGLDPLILIVALGVPTTAIAAYFLQKGYDRLLASARIA